MQSKKQLKVQYIGIFEEIDSFYWPKMHCLKEGQKIRAWVDPPPPLIMPERKRFFSLRPSLNYSVLQLCKTASQIRSGRIVNLNYTVLLWKIFYVWIFDDHVQRSVVSSPTGSKVNRWQEKRLVQLNQRKRWKTTLSHLPQTTHRLCRYIMRLFLDWLCKTVTHFLLSCSKGLNCRISNGPWSVILQKVPENISEKSICWPEWLGSVKEVLDPVPRLNADKRPADRESQTNPFLF